MSITVVLIAYHGDRWLPDCLASLVEASVHPLHLVLVDNAENTIIENLDLAAFDAEVLSTPYPMGFAEANNYALVETSHLEDKVLFLNQDTISPVGWVEACQEVLNSNSNLGALSPLIRTYEDDGWDPSFMACLSETQQVALQDEAPLDDVLLTKNAPAPALLVRTDVLKKAGPFDPVFGSYYEDYDLCRRIRAVGYKIGFCTKAHLRHFSGSSIKTESQEHQRMRQVIRNRVLYQLRESEEPRFLSLLHWILKDFPHRLARGIIGTSSSQPPKVTLRAYNDLLRIGSRLVSETYDKAEWDAYLKKINWHAQISNHKKN